MAMFNPDKDIPDLSGKVILVTGGSDGLGRETVLQLSKHNPAHIFLAARNKSKAFTAIEGIRKTVPDAAPITYLSLDLASFDSIKKAVAEFLAQSRQLHILVNNAGIMGVPPGKTKDGYEIQFGTNHVGHALLIKLLLPTLSMTAVATSPPQDVRIITVASKAEGWGPFPSPSEFDKFKTDMSSISTFARYGISKAANVLYAHALCQHHPEIRSISLHPGSVSTNISSGIAASWPILKPLLRVGSIFGKIVADSVSTGAKNQLWAAVSPDAKSGEFYHPVGVLGKGTENSRNGALADDIWKWTERELEHYISNSC
ncbi:related to alcohol dehydrogenase homolog Bli-4 [Fusarium oxysporum]|uniref:Related to alcohol dehydrogenase homolog Bli-4 n=1 Tax=Fusarium oxysporum TaxID=5507 RepID=A0A2H3UBG5_FUSOX|nr:related to alcohol dehydrogenase homolog Bli-4 [Fusarium oxysporum]